MAKKGKAAQSAAATNETQPTEPTTPATDTMKSQPATTQASGVINLGSRIQVQNTSHEIQIIPLGDRRKRLVPNEIWPVDDEYTERIKDYFKTPFYQALEAKGFLRIHTSTPSRLGEVEFKSPQTPEPPDKLVEKPEHVTKAEFVKEEE